MFLHLVLEHQFGTHHASRKIVSGMFEIGTYTQVFWGFGLIEPILTLNVIFLLFLGVESAAQKRETCVGGKLAGNAECTEVGEEAVFFLTVKIYSEALYVFHCSELRFSVFRFEVVVIIRDVAYEVKLPAFVGLVTQICLIVQIVWLVFAFGFHRTEQVRGGFVAHAIEPWKFLGSQTDVCVSTQQTGSQTAFNHRLLAFCFQGFVGDVESRTHLVSVFGSISSGWETDFIYHIRVDDGEAFLLSAANQEWAENFYVVDVYGVLIKGTATYIILRREFVVGTHASLLLNQTFHPISVGRWRHLHVLSLQLLYLVRLYFFSLDIHLIEGGGCFAKYHLQGLFSSRSSQHFCFCLETDIWEFDYHAVCRMQFEAIVSLERSNGSLSLASHRNDGKLQGLVVLVYHFAVKGKLLRHHLYGCDEAYCEYQ